MTTPQNTETEKPKNPFTGLTVRRDHTHEEAQCQACLHNTKMNANEMCERLHDLLVLLVACSPTPIAAVTMSVDVALLVMSANGMRHDQMMSMLSDSKELLDDGEVGEAYRSVAKEALNAALEDHQLLKKKLPVSAVSMLRRLRGNYPPASHTRKEVEDAGELIFAKARAARDEHDATCPCVEPEKAAAEPATSPAFVNAQPGQPGHIEDPDTAAAVADAVQTLDLQKMHAIASEAQAKGTCVVCGKSPTFTTEAGRREYGISGTCEPCFDAMFPEEAR